MGAQNSFTCGECGYTVTTSGPWEFYRDEDGARHPYGHPGPASREARERGVWGLSAELYCPDCDEVHDIVVVEFVEPVSDARDVWMRNYTPRQEFQRPGGVRCPGCGGTFMLLGPEGAPPVDCPRCGSVSMTGKQDWIS